MLRCPGLVLRCPRPGDRGRFLALRAANRSHLDRWFPRRSDNSVDEYAASFERALAASTSQNSRPFFVCGARDGVILGQVGLSNITRGAFQSCTIGYWIAGSAQGKGLMTRAVARVVEHAFRDMQLHRVEANIMPRNARSIALVKRLGFRYEGTAKRYLQIAGAWEDHERWGVTIEEWKRAKAAR